jgi:hypothetical protein
MVSSPVLPPQREYAFSTNTRPICPRCPLHSSLMFLSLTSQSFSQNSAATFITAFFAEYPEFDYDSTAPVTQEYRRLTQESDWMPRSQEDKKAKAAFGTAMGKQFASFYGSSIHDIKAWKALCEALGVDPIPKTIAECRDVRTEVLLPSPCCHITIHVQQLIKSKHVNLVDFIDTRITGDPIKIFKTEKELREYTRGEDKYYPKKSAKESGVLKYLLRKILRPNKKS